MSVKALLYSRPKADGTYPLAVRITKHRKSSYLFLGYLLREDQWDEANHKVRKSHPNSVRLNNLLAQKLAEASDKAIETDIQQPDSTAKVVHRKLKAKGSTTFFPQAEIFLSNLEKAGKYNQHVAEKPRVKHFQQFLNGEDIAFTDITPALLTRFRLWLKGARDMGERTIINHLVFIRSVFSQAMKSDLVDRKYYPFGKDKVKIKYPETAKIGLSREELTALESLEPTEPFYHHARNLWLVSYYFAGMRVSDVLRLKWSDFRQGRMHYTMGKNNKPGSLKVPEQVLSILDQYDKEHELVFPDLRGTDLADSYATQRRISFTTGRVDKVLRKYIRQRAGIAGKLTMHIARHTFAQLSADKIPVQILQKLYRHSNIQTTMGYQSQFVNKDVDEALDAVLNG